MSYHTIRHFLAQNTDFQGASLFGVFLGNPWVLATSTYDLGYIYHDLIPPTDQLLGGSVWELRQPDATIVYTRNKYAPSPLVRDWVVSMPSDPWLGIEALIMMMVMCI